MPSTTVLSYQWTCPGGYCDAGGVDSEWATRIQQGNILVVNVRRHDADSGTYSCSVVNTNSAQEVGSASHSFTVGSELLIFTPEISLWQFDLHLLCSEYHTIKL